MVVKFLGGQIQPRLTGLRLQMLVGLAAKGGAAIASFAFSWLIARQYGADGVGLYSIALTTAVFGSTAALVGLEYITVRSVATHHAANRTGEARRVVVQAAKQTAILACAGAFMLFFLRDVFAGELLEEPKAGPFLGIMALAIPLIAFTKLASATLRGSGKVLVSQLIDGPIGTGGAAIALAILILAGDANYALLPVILYCVFGLLAALSGWIALSRQMKDWEPLTGEKLRTIAMGLPILCAVLSNLFSDWFATVVLTAESGPGATGLFRVSFQIVAVLNLLIIAAESILGPPIAQAYAAGDMERIGDLIRKTAVALLAIASPFLGLIFIAPQFVLSLFGPEFVGAVPALMILAVGQLVNLIGGPVGLVLIMAGRERWTLAYGVVAALMSAGLCLWLIPDLGLIGASIAVTSATIMRRVAAAVLVRRFMNIPLIRIGKSEPPPASNG